MTGINNQEKLEREDYYLDERGFLIFTEAYLLKRGYCCDNGCRHCPYTYSKKKNKTQDKNKLS